VYSADSNKLIKSSSVNSLVELYLSWRRLARVISAFSMNRHGEVDTCMEFLKGTVRNLSNP
jgi:hypothetical protein